MRKGFKNRPRSQSANPESSHQPCVEVECLAVMPEACLPPDVDAALGEAVMEAARAAYASPGRHYHTWAHIEACLREAHGLTFDDAPVVYAALLFHDAIYVAGAKDNEARSAKLAATQLQGLARFDAARIARVEHLIMLTASHAALPADAPGDDKKLIDIDLSILAAPAETYRRYAQEVRREWVPGVVSEAQYAHGRAAFLRGVLAAPRIFHSADFSAREVPARANIERELSDL
jgi:predicted metal-dependent HD superfamily phosphohydrolase